jgi:hypothetical protein
MTKKNKTIQLHQNPNQIPSEILLMKLLKEERFQRFPINFAQSFEINFSQYLQKCYHISGVGIFQNRLNP